MIDEDHGGVSMDQDHFSSLWDWGNLLDFTADEELSINLDSIDAPVFTEKVTDQAESGVPDRTRKRDLRLSCSNFLAGRIPCSCPEVDEKLEEEERARLKKRVRITGVGTSYASCQVPGCKADISELKGYHKRHRVCLCCANASHVILDGESKRYCQQCGKFHMLSDFDEDKRSCRRKLERHNNRRRRKPLQSVGETDKESKGDLQMENTSFDACLPKVSIVCSASDSQNHKNDNIVSIGVSDEAGIDGFNEDSKVSPAPSSSLAGKDGYSSVCPTGRICFKLYDWNPAEFPRRLRHQIFQWLASMPVELEEYIRPGCTILTAFVAMPSSMWAKLLEGSLSHLHDLVVPGKILSGKGPILVYLNNTTFHVKHNRSGTSVVKIKMKGLVPRLHYVHPTCFEAGKPVEFIACGSNLWQSKFRFLVSFAGKYVPCEYIIEPNTSTGGSCGLDHELCKIFIPHLESNIWGPAFVEVENECGLSNFIPILIGDRETCSEMRLLQRVTYGSDSAPPPPPPPGEASASKQETFSEFMVDVAWLLQEPSSKKLSQAMSSSSTQIQRLRSILKILLLHESVATTEKILRRLKIMNLSASCRHGGRLLHLHQLMNHYCKHLCSATEEKVRNQGRAQDHDHRAGHPGSIPAADGPLWKAEVVMDVNRMDQRECRSSGSNLLDRVARTQSAAPVVVLCALCLVACALLLHTRCSITNLASSIRQCLAGRIELF